MYTVGTKIAEIDIFGTFGGAETAKSAKNPKMYTVDAVLRCFWGFLLK